MAVTYVGTATANNGQSVGFGSASFTMPGAVGDTAIVCGTVNSGVADFTTPSADWVPLLAAPLSINGNLMVQAWAKDLVSGDPGATFTWGTTGSVTRFPGDLVVLRGTAAGQLSVPTPTTHTTAVTSHANPALTTTINDTEIVSFWALRNATATAPTITVPTSHTAASVSKTAFSTSPNYTLQSSYLTTPGAAGPYGGQVATTSSATSIVLSVAAPPVGAGPVAAFTMSASSGIAPLAVTFTDTSTGSPTSRLWDFGDGTTSTTTNPSHTFTTSGTYDVTLTASNTSGSSSVTQSVVVSNPVATGGGFASYVVRTGAWVPITINVNLP